MRSVLMPYRGWFAALMLCMGLLGAAAQAAPAAPPQAKATLTSSNGYSTLLVDGRPFVVIGGELYNSSASSASHLDSLWPQLKRMNLNTVLVNVNWQQFEPKEGQFDYTLIDHLLQRARENDLRLVILWFASWKNGESSYPPLWVRDNTKRFPRVLNKQGDSLETLSVFSRETLEADKKAYVKLAQRIRAKDHSNRVIMMQVQNEVGILGSDFDYSKTAAGVLAQPVPPALLSYMATNKPRLRRELLAAWQTAGERTNGSWLDVFGDTVAAREFALAWGYASYIGEIASAGRRVLDLPTFVNAWIVQNDQELPGQYPAGGPVSRVLDVYKAAAPGIDLLAPDIYLADFKGIVDDYRRADNPLFVPESTFEPGRAYYTIGEHCALGYSPFGIDDGLKWPAFVAGYGVLHEMKHLLASQQCAERTRFGIHKQGAETGRTIELDDLTITVRYPRGDLPAYGLLLRTGPTEFHIAGVNLIVEFKSRMAGRIARIAEVHDGQFVAGAWRPGRLLNGDDTFHNAAVRVYGRSWIAGPTFATDANLPPQPTIANVISPVSASGPANGQVPVPGIYRVQLYWRDSRQD